jgi:hypothetical protein
MTANVGMLFSSQGRAILAYLVVVLMVLGITRLLGLSFLRPRATRTALLVGSDGRASTSKFQLTIWVYAATFVLLALMLIRLFDQVAQDQKVANQQLLGTTKAQMSYLVLLTVPLVVVLLAKAIVTVKISSGTLQKIKPAGDPRWSELVLTDENEADLLSLQYLIFGALALAYPGTRFLLSPREGLPEMPDGLVLIVLLSGAFYLLGKALYQNPPVLTGIEPAAAAHADTIHVRGRNFIPPHDRPGAGSVHTGHGCDPVVLVQGYRANVQTATADHITASIPAEVAMGEVDVFVYTSAGLATEPVRLQVVSRDQAQPVILSVRPRRIWLGHDKELLISGRYFVTSGIATARNAVLLRGRAMPAGACHWENDQQVRVTLPTGRREIRQQRLRVSRADIVVHNDEGIASEPVEVLLERTFW